MMTSRKVLLLCLGLVLFVAASAAQAQMQQQAPSAQSPAAMPAGAPAQPQSACGNQPLCTDTPDFTATVTDFRLTVANGNLKVIDVVIRFQNKTNDNLILGYVNGTEMALDDQGNRYAPNPWGNAFNGIGLINGGYIDPKFAMRVGSWGDARFELVWRPGPQDPIGSTFELAMTIREITTMPGGQHGLGGEFPLDIRGLANGVTGVSPGYAARGTTAGASSILPSGGSAGAATPILASAAGATGTTGNAGTLPTCPPGMVASSGAVAAAAKPTAAQNAPANSNSNAAANNTNAAVQSTSQAISNIASLFGKKKPAVAPGANTAAPTNCVPATPASPATPANTAVNGSTAQPATAQAAKPATAAAQPAAANAKATAQPAKTTQKPTTPQPADQKKPAETDKPSSPK